MKVKKQTIATAAPRVVSTVETVTGKVWQVNPPSRGVLTLAKRENQEFKIPKGQKFVIDGQETGAQRVTEVLETVVAQEIKSTGTAPLPPPPANPDVPILAAMARPVPISSFQTATTGKPTEQRLRSFRKRLVICRSRTT
jgi:hypothetical protein